MNRFSRAFFDWLEGVSNWIDDKFRSWRYYFMFEYGWLGFIPGRRNARLSDICYEIWWHEVDIRNHKSDDPFPITDIYIKGSEAYLAVLLAHYRREKYFWMKRK